MAKARDFGITVLALVLSAFYAVSLYDYLTRTIVHIRVY